MTPVERSFAGDPLVAAAIRLHGLDIAALPWEPCDEVEGSEVAMEQFGGAPQLHLHSDGTARIFWWLTGRYASYVFREGETRIVTLSRTETPDILLATMPGKALSRIVDAPGAEGMEIVEAINSRTFATDPYDTRIEIQPREVTP